MTVTIERPEPYRPASPRTRYINLDGSNINRDALIKDLGLRDWIAVAARKQCGGPTGVNSVRVVFADSCDVAEADRLLQGVVDWHLGRPAAGAGDGDGAAEAVGAVDAEPVDEVAAGRPAVELWDREDAPDADSEEPTDAERTLARIAKKLLKCALAKAGDRTVGIRIASPDGTTVSLEINPTY